MRRNPQIVVPDHLPFALQLRPNRRPDPHRTLRGASTRRPPCPASSPRNFTTPRPAIPHSLTLPPNRLRQPHRLAVPRLEHLRRRHLQPALKCIYVKYTLSAHRRTVSFWSNYWDAAHSPERHDIEVGSTKTYTTAQTSGRPAGPSLTSSRVRAAFESVRRFLSAVVLQSVALQRLVPSRDRFFDSSSLGKTHLVPPSFGQWSPWAWGIFC